MLPIAGVPFILVGTVDNIDKLMQCLPEMETWLMEIRRDLIFMVL